MPQFPIGNIERLIGRSLHYRGIPCRVIDVLPEGPAVVLEGTRPDRAIQANQYGEATRRAPETFSVPLLNIRGDDINPVLLALKPFLETD